MSMTFFGHRFSFYASHSTKKTMPARASTGQQQAPSSWGLFFKKVRHAFSDVFFGKPVPPKHVCGKACGLGCFLGGDGPRDNPFSMAPQDRYSKVGRDAYGQ